MKMYRLLLVVLITLIISGCNRVVIHPIEASDIIILKKDKSYTAPKDGYFLSKMYLEKVAKAKVK